MQSSDCVDSIEVCAGDACADNIYQLLGCPCCKNFAIDDLPRMMALQQLLFLCVNMTALPTVPPLDCLAMTKMLAPKNRNAC